MGLKVWRRMDSTTEPYSKSTQSMTKWVCLACGAEHFEERTHCANDGEPLTAVRLDTLVGTIFAQHYEIIALLGRGGMSSVYKVRNIFTDRICALKLMHAHMMSDTQSVRRFQLEAKAASSLSHPNLLGVQDFGVTDQGVPYLVMDYIDGTSLSDILDEHNHISLDRCVDIVKQVLAGLQHAHENNIIHRDLKPSNIMLVTMPNGLEQARIVDFGIAKILDESGASSKLTNTGEVFGSPAYMSPEQCLSRPADARSDIYSMGCVIYQCLSGQVPFLGSSPLETITKQINEDPPNLAKVSSVVQVPVLIEEVVQKAMEKDPAKRYKSAAEFAKAFSEAGDKSHEQEALQFLAARMRMRARSVRQSLMSNIVKLTLSAIAVVSLAVAVLYLNPALRATVHRTCSPTLFNLAYSTGRLLSPSSQTGKLFAPWGYPAARFLLENAVHEADVSGLTDAKMDSRDSLQHLYKENADYAQEALVDRDIKAIKAKWLKEHYGVIRKDENGLVLNLVNSTEVPTDSIKAVAMGSALADLAELSLKQGANDLAESEAALSLRIWTDRQEKNKSTLKCMLVLAESYAQKGAFTDAQDGATELIDEAQSMATPQFGYIARAQILYAQTELMQNKLDSAEKWFKSAISTAAKIPSKDKVEKLKVSLREYLAFTRHAVNTLNDEKAALRQIQQPAARLSEIDRELIRLSAVSGETEHELNELEREHPTPAQGPRSER